MRSSTILAVGAMLALAGCGASGSTPTSSRAAQAPVASSSHAQTAREASAGMRCKKVKAPVPRPLAHLSAPTLRLRPTSTYTVTIVTNCGSFAIELDVRDSPKTSASFYYLVKRGFYNGLSFQRVAAGFVIQGGDPQENDTGGPGYTVVEAPPKGTTYRRGDVAMARAQSQPIGASGSQFFVVLAANSELPAQYAVLGKVVSGMNVVQEIGRLPTDPPGDGYPTPAVVIASATASVS